MPIYEYEHGCERCGECGERFEVLQSMNELPLTRCPTCGQPCHRVLSTFATITNEKAKLSPRNLERHGFTQYKRAGDGYCEKTCGKGPRVIKGDCG
jgi:putative FmdB family regulatory protein